jgi:hypothetical protein
VVADVPVAAQDLHRAVGDGQGHVVGEGLGENGLADAVAALVQRPGRFPYEEPRRLDLGGHLRPA